MKTKILLLYICWLVLFVSASCKREFLETSPTDRISQENFWRQEKDGIFAVNAVYTSLDVFRMFGFEACSDNATTAKTWTDSYQVANGSFNSSWPWVYEAWRDGYRGIRKANDVIANIDRISNMDENLRKRLKAEARVLRAFVYNLLINLYGDVPLITEPITVVDDAQAPREAKSNITAFIIDDLNAAIPDLPVKYTNNNDIGRITKGAAYALMARVYLWQNDFENARNAAQEVINLGVYDLLPKYSELFTYENENNIEVILDNQFMPVNRMHNSFQVLGPRSSEGLSNYVPTRELVDAYDEKDSRRRSTILFPGDVNPYEEGNVIFNPTPGSRTPDEATVSYDATATGYHYKKYVLKEDREFNTRCHINLVQIRYADVLLMFAEADNEVNGPTQAAYDAINSIRNRANNERQEGQTGLLENYAGLTKEEFREAIRNERRVELAGEGLRYFDILRWRIAEDVLNGAVHGMDYLDRSTNAMRTIRVETRKFDKDKNYLWPLPEQEIRLNPNLGRQNPGY